MDDRRAVEDMYLKGLLRVVIATSVRAVILCYTLSIYEQRQDSGRWRQLASVILASVFSSRLMLSM